MTCNLIQSMITLYILHNYRSFGMPTIPTAARLKLESRMTSFSIEDCNHEMYEMCMQVMSLQPTTTGKQRSRRPLPLWVKLPCWQALRGSTASGPVVTGSHCVIARLHCFCVYNGVNACSQRLVKFGRFGCMQVPVV